MKSDGTVVPISAGRVAAVRASINARAAYLEVDDDLRRKWVGKAIRQLEEGASAGWAISEAIRGMTSEHIASKGKW